MYFGLWAIMKVGQSSVSQSGSHESASQPVSHQSVSQSSVSQSSVSQSSVSQSSVSRSSVIQSVSHVSESSVSQSVALSVGASVCVVNRLLRQSVRGRTRRELGASSMTWRHKEKERGRVGLSADGWEAVR
jgi:hypothetical protein